METANAVTEIISQLFAAFGAIAWPLVIIVIILMFRRQIFYLFERLSRVKAYTVEMIFENMEKKGELTPTSRSDLSGLSAHDIWALNDFAEKKISVPVEVIKMNAAQRVAARTLVDAGLLHILGEGADRHVEVSDLGRKVLAAAKQLPL
jgi:hypothetical protein